MGQTASAHWSCHGMGTQLIKASKAGDADSVTELVSCNPQLLHYCTFRHLSPCHYAARADHVCVLQQLVAKAQEIEQLKWQAVSDRLQMVPVHTSRAPVAPMQMLATCQDSLVRQILNASTDRGVTPLMLAVNGGCLASVKFLLDTGADPWAVDKMGGRTALHYAARQDNIDIVQLLVAAAGSEGPVHFPNRPRTSYVDVRTQTGFTPLHFAIHAEQQESLAVLLNLGANPQLPSLFDCMDFINCPKGTTPLHLAARMGSQDLAKQLLRGYFEYWYHRQLPDPRLLMDGNDQLPCQVAQRRLHLEVASMLLPSTPFTSLFREGELFVLGPPTLAAIAGGVLRSVLASDLTGVMKQQQQEVRTPEEASAAGAEDSAVQASRGHHRGSAAAVHTSDEQGVRHPGALCRCVSSSGNEGGAEDVVYDVSDAPADGTSHNDTPPLAEDSCAEEEVVVAEVDGEEDSEDADSKAGDNVCGVCFEPAPQVRMSPCGHLLCVSCCSSLLGLHSRCVMLCPFCRAGVAHLQPLTALGTPPGALHTHQVCTLEVHQHSFVHV